MLAGDVNANTMFGIVKFQSPQARSSWNYPLVLASKSQLHNALCITLLIGEVIFWTLWYIRTADSQRSLPWIFTYQSYLAFWSLLERGKLQIQLKN
jgi:hypothetical protein